MKLRALLGAVLLFTGVLSAQSFESYCDSVIGEWLKEYQVQDERDLIEAMGSDNSFIKFKRWQEYWTTRLDVNGNFPAPETNYLEYQKIFGKRPQTFRDNHWEAIGPDSEFSNKYAGIGRLNCVAFDPTDENIIYVGAPSGGIWKTTTGGNEWVAIGNEIASTGVSDIIIDPRDSQHLYIATGDGDGGSSASQITRQGSGDSKSIGVLESFDGGETFQATGLSFLYQDRVLMRRLIHDPLNPDILFAATNAGVYRSADAGVSWDRLIEGAFIDVELHPADSSILYAATSGFGAVFTALDSETGELLNFRQFSGSRRIKIGVSPAMPDQVNLCVVNPQGGLDGIYSSTDTGASFNLVFNDLNLLSSAAEGSGTSGQGSYDLTYSINPENPDIQFVGGVNNWKSTDGGNSWELNTLWFSNGRDFNTHADKHFLAWHPITGELWETNDGGVYKTSNLGNTWQDMSNGLQIGQIYRMAQDPENQEFLLLGHQDNSTIVMEDGSSRDFIGTGDGMTQLIHPIDPRFCATSSYYGNFIISANQFNSSEVNYDNNVPNGPWITPAQFVVNDPSVIIAGSNGLYKGESRDWTRISGSFSPNGTLRHLVWDASNPLIMYAATYTAAYKIEFTDDSYTNIENASLISLGTNSNTFNAISFIHSYSKGGTTYLGICLSNYNENWSYLEVESEELTVSNLSEGLPQIPMTAAVLDPLSETLFIGTDIGVLFYNNATSEWEPYSEGLPNVMISGLAVDQTNRTLTASTFGRGVWRSPLPEGLSTLNANIALVQNAICTGDTLTLTPAFFSNQNTYTWTAEPDLIGDITQSGRNFSFVFASSGDKTISLEVENEAGESANSSITFTINPYLPIPEIETGDKQVSCTYEGADEYIWTKDGSSYPQNSQVLSDPGSGIYSVRIEQNGFCNSESSDDIEFIALSNAIINSKEIKAYPNPVVDVLHYQTNGSAKKARLFDLAGNLLYIKVNPNTENTIYMDKYPEGSYILSIEYENGRREQINIQKL